MVTRFPYLPLLEVLIFSEVEPSTREMCDEVWGGGGDWDEVCLFARFSWVRSVLADVLFSN